jgi:tRNA-dihydrouridine synthase A
MSTAIKPLNNDSHKFCVAPMMEWTDRHDRYFLRQISKRARLYTEMITTPAILFGDKKRLLNFNFEEHPIALQLGGSDVFQMTECARIAEDWGYDEVNINVGCPSDRVQNGYFGACLMKEPSVIAKCVESMSRVVKIPITVKCRIGVDDQNPEDVLPDFIEKIASAGCEVFIIHARKAFLKGLNPSQNRDIPPLNYSLVEEMKERWPKLKIILNGGLKSVEEARHHLSKLDGVMLGRAAYKTPWILSTVDKLIYGEPEIQTTREHVIDTMTDYAANKKSEGIPVKSITRHMLGLFHAEPGAKAWRKILSEEARLFDAKPEIISQAYSAVCQAARVNLQGEAA